MSLLLTVQSLLKHHLSPSPHLLILTHSHLCPISIKPPEPLLQRPTMTIQQTFYSHLYVISQENLTWFSIPCLLTHFLRWLSGTPHFPCYHQFFAISSLSGHQIVAHTQAPRTSIFSSNSPSLGDCTLSQLR